MVDISKLEAFSALPGLQNSGQTFGTATLSGTLNPNGTDGSTSNLTGSFVISLPQPTVISVMRVNLPDAHGDLATSWFPVMGTVELVDATLQWNLLLYVSSHPQGRQIDFNFRNNSTNVTWTANNFRINVYAHLYSYPW